MPPRHAYWTILVDDQPTAFRAHDPEELLATLNRLKDKHPSAVMKWFERGKLWESRDEAREAGQGQGERRWEGSRPDRPAEPAREKPRDRSWRPGGEHQDPRQKYKDAKKAKWDRFKQNIRDRSERSAGSNPTPDPQKFSPPHGDPLRDKVERPPARKPPSRPEGRPERRDFRPAGGDDRRGDWQPKGPPRGPGGWKPGGPPSRPGGWKPSGPPRGPGGLKPGGPPRGDRPPQDRDGSGWQGRERPGGDWRDRPPRDRDGGRDFSPAGSPKPGARKPWGAKPGGFGAKKPGGSKPGGAGRAKSGGTGPGYRGPGGPRRPGSGKGPRGPRKPRGE